MLRRRISSISIDGRMPSTSPAIRLSFRRVRDLSFGPGAGMEMALPAAVAAPCWSFPIGVLRRGGSGPFPFGSSSTNTLPGSSCLGRAWGGSGSSLGAYREAVRFASDTYDSGEGPYTMGGRSPHRGRSGSTMDPSGRSSSNSSGSGGGGMQLHRFIRDNPSSRPSTSSPSGSSSSGGGTTYSTGGSSSPSSFSPRYRGNASYPTGGGGSSPSPDVLPTSWSTRLQAELIREVDPLGGLAHKDVYRDPALGYTPQYAPRDFSDGGGTIRYHHPRIPLGPPQSSSSLYDPSQSHGNTTPRASGSGEGLYQQQATSHRAFFEEEQQQWVDGARRVRGVLREVLTDPAQREAYLQRTTPSSWIQEGEGERSQGRLSRMGKTAGPQGKEESQAFFAPTSHYAHSPSVDPVEMIRNETTGRMERTRRISSRFSTPPPSSATGAAPVQLPLHSALPVDALQQHLQRQGEDHADDLLAEYLHLVKGGRARERFDFGFLQRSSRLVFQGYDRDRWKAQRDGAAYGAKRLPPLLPPSSMTEAQTTLRDGAELPTEMAIAQEQFARNTTAATPLLGESLTETTLAAIREAKQHAKTFRKEKQAERFGLGRRAGGTPLVHDGGPDQRPPLARGQHDERLVDALKFGSNAYRRTAGDEYTNPYLYRDTQFGVGHLLQTAFEVQRRGDALAKGKTDPTERSMQHFGTPIAQQIDEFVFRHRNARGERPMEYFKPFPHFRDLRLYNGVYEDIEGFPYLRARPEFLEWDLFLRYRAHYEQRRALALRHGLEPVKNETASERDARRLQLDILCENTLFDESQFQIRESEAEKVSVDTLRGWFGAYVLPSPTILKEVLRLPPEEAVAKLWRARATAAAAAGGAFSLPPPPTSPPLQLLPDPVLGTPDTREPLLSSRYFHQLALMEGIQRRLQRGYLKELIGSGGGGGGGWRSLPSGSASGSGAGGGGGERGEEEAAITTPAPELKLSYAVPEQVLRHFDANELAMYHTYVNEEQEKHENRWEVLRQHRRLVPVSRLSSKAATNNTAAEGEEEVEVASVVLVGTSVKVMDLQHAETGRRRTTTADTAKGGHHQDRADGDGTKGTSSPRDHQPSSSRSSGGSGTLPGTSTTQEGRSASSPSLIRLEDGLYQPLPGTERVLTPLVIRVVSTGEQVRMTTEEWNCFPMEIPASAVYNHALDFGVGPYAYNRSNYVETQDVLWEKHTASGREGWSPATHADGLRPGLPVRARRPLRSSSSVLLFREVTTTTTGTSLGGDAATASSLTTSGVEITTRDALLLPAVSSMLETVDGAGGEGEGPGSSGRITTPTPTTISLQGEYSRGEIVVYEPQPFFNPDPRRVRIRFLRGRSSGVVHPTRDTEHNGARFGKEEEEEIIDVPLEDVMIWQRRYHGPERTVPDETRRYNPAGLRRYVRVQPEDFMPGAKPGSGRGKHGGGEGANTEHFLDKYQPPQTDLLAERVAPSLKQITELDQWNVYDTRRADNFRPLSISHRRDYVRQGYMPAYTPWEWISIQEGDQPLLTSTIRQDHMGPSAFFSLRRHWRHKARPHGYLRHYDNEIRDFFQFVDGVVPWEKAQKIRTYWEVREHHPIPQINRPEVAMHWNTAGLLPAHMWVTDKKTGKVKGVKDSVRDYRTTTPLPKWVKL